MTEPVLDQHVNVERLWAAARDAAAHGEKWGQRKKAVTDALLTYYSGLRRDRRGAHTWVEKVLHVIGHFTPDTAAATVTAALHLLDETGDTSTVIAALRADGTLGADATKNSLFKSS